MSTWPAKKARLVLAALERIGWRLKRQSGSHRTLSRDGWPDVVFAFHDDVGIGPKMLARIAKKTGLTPDDLWSYPVWPTRGFSRRGSGFHLPRSPASRVSPRVLWVSGWYPKRLATARESTSSNLGHRVA